MENAKVSFQLQRDHLRGETTGSCSGILWLANAARQKAKKYPTLF